ncbi:MAG: sugar phosphate isomerase/epimerase [Fimbriimonadales bacterium]|nr:sugar phosphate isomerase/epimerase [Fimbriimonadales bacterium]
MAIKVGVQLYSVRDDCKRDLPYTLAEVAKIGYAGVEFAGYYDYDAATLRKMLDENGLECCGTHIGLDALLGDNLQRTLEFHATLKCPYLIVPGLPPERTASRDAWLETAQIFNEIAEKIKPHGFRTGYHNHWIEFQPFENGELPWDVFFSHTSPDVIMQIDTGNALHGGAHAAPFVRKYPGRALTVHCKEFSSTNNSAVIGEGEVQWADFFDACETVGGTQWYIVEQETYAHTPLETIQLCFEAMKRMGKV